MKLKRKTKKVEEMLLVKHIVMTKKILEETTYPYRKRSIFAANGTTRTVLSLGNF